MTVLMRWYHKNKIPLKNVIERFDIIIKNISALLKFMQ